MSSVEDPRGQTGTPGDLRRGRTAVTLADIPHVWDGSILMTSVRGAADLMGVSMSTVRNWVRNGTVTGARYMPSGRKYIPVRELWKDRPPDEVEAQIARMREGAARLREIRDAKGARGARKTGEDNADVDQSADLGLPAPVAQVDLPGGE